MTLLAEWPEAEGVGTDIDPAALAVAAENAARHGVEARAAFRLADWTDGIEGRFELVVSNPPYIPAADVEGLAADVRDWEPRHALTAGPTGLEAYRRIAAGLAAVLAPGGRALFEVGAGQGAAVAALFPRARGCCIPISTGGTGWWRSPDSLRFLRLSFPGGCLYAPADPATMSEFIRVTPVGSDTCTDTSGRRIAAEAAAWSASPQPQWRKLQGT